MKKRAKLITIILILLLSLWLFSKFNLSSLWVQILQNIHELGIWGVIIFMVFYNLATLCLIPGSILTMKGGCLYGLIHGSIIVFVSATFGAITSFLLGRYVCKNWVYSMLNKYPQFIQINEAISKKGWQIVFLSRLSPLFPFNLLNYLFGISKISFQDYLIGSLGIIPGTLMYVYFGSLATNLATANVDNIIVTPKTQIITWTVRIIGLISTIMITIISTNFARKNLNKNLNTNDNIRSEN